MSFKKIFGTLKKFKDVEVLVVGDTIIDTYVSTTLLGNNAKTPTFSTKYLGKKKFIGGAAIVAQHLKSAGAKVKFCSVLGKDSLSNLVKKRNKKSGIKDLILIDPQRPTTEKKYFISDGHRLLKVDTVENSPIRSETLNKICNHIKKHKKGIVIFSDFRHGIFF